MVGKGLVVAKRKSQERKKLFKVELEGWRAAGKWKGERVPKADELTGAKSRRQDWAVPAGRQRGDPSH